MEHETNRNDVAVGVRCLCGKHMYHFTVMKRDLPLKGRICHCNECRHGSGVLCSTYGFVPKGVEDEILKQYKTTATAQVDTSKHLFCDVCGTRLLHLDHASSTYAIATGTLDRVEGLVSFDEHLHINQTQDGGLSDWLPSINGVKLQHIKEDERGQKSQSDTAQSGTTSATDTSLLHAHCQCEGVQLWIKRPSLQSLNADSPYPDVLLPYYITDRPVNAKWWLRCNGTKFLAGLCTCDSCRLATGYEFQTWAFIPAVDISLSADGSVPFRRGFGTSKAYRSSDEATRHFCGVCGATVFWDGDARPTLLDVSVGLFAAPEGARAESWFDWRTEMVSYRGDGMKRAHSLVTSLEDGLAQWAKDRDSR